MPSLPFHLPWLAPLAGFSDLPFRLLCRYFGCAVACTEMISAKGLVYGSEGTSALLATCPDDTPLVVQLFGREPEFIARAMDLLLEKGYVFFDLNCGCSVKKVIKTGSGCALMREPDLLLEILSAMVQKAGPSRVGVKIRLGWESATWPNLAPAIEQTGASWICLHPRTGRQGFRGQADWKSLYQLKQTVNIPVIGSGDILSAQAARDCLQQTGIDTVLFARGALADPSVFAKFHKLQAGEPLQERTVEEIQTLTLSMENFYVRYGCPRQALLRMRTLLPRFVKDMPGAKEIRKKIQSCTTWEDVHVLLKKTETE